MYMEVLLGSTWVIPTTPMYTLADWLKIEPVASRYSTSGLSLHDQFSVKFNILADRESYSDSELQCQNFG
jgi:hypothetical protein